MGRDFPLENGPGDPPECAGSLVCLSIRRVERYAEKDARRRRIHDRLCDTHRSARLRYRSVRNPPDSDGEWIGRVRDGIATVGTVRILFMGPLESEGVLHQRTAGRAERTPAGIGP